MRTLQILGSADEVWTVHHHGFLNEIVPTSTPYQSSSVVLIEGRQTMLELTFNGLLNELADLVLDVWREIPEDRRSDLFWLRRIA